MASRILIVGAQPGAGTPLAIKLGLDGYDTYTAADAQEAASVAHWWLPQVAVIDLGHRPDEQLAAVARLRHTHPSLPLFSVARQEDFVCEEEVERAGISVQFTWPLDFREFRLALEWVIRDGAHAADPRLQPPPAQVFPLQR